MMPRLTYLFRATLRDGTVIRQTDADVSVDAPLTRSAFYDVQQRLLEVVRFTLTDGVRSHSVDLETGIITSDGQTIVSPRPDLHDFRVIYFRRVQELVTLGQDRDRRVVAFFIGWQANDDTGKNWQMLLEVPSNGPAKLTPQPN